MKSINNKETQCDLELQINENLVKRKSVLKNKNFQKFFKKETLDKSKNISLNEIFPENYKKTKEIKMFKVPNIKSKIPIILNSENGSFRINEKVSHKKNFSLEKFETTSKINSTTNSNKIQTKLVPERVNLNHQNFFNRDIYKYTTLLSENPNHEIKAVAGKFKFLVNIPEFKNCDSESSDEGLSESCESKVYSKYLSSHSSSSEMEDKVKFKLFKKLNIIGKRKNSNHNKSNRHSQIKSKDKVTLPILTLENKERNYSNKITNLKKNLKYIREFSKKKDGDKEYNFLKESENMYQRIQAYAANRKTKFEDLKNLEYSSKLKI